MIISNQYNNESMMDIYFFETTQLIEQLEQSMLDGEKANYCTRYNIDEIFRIMHTLKGSSAMMHFDDISMLAHKMEDLFYYIRENESIYYDCSALCDLVLESTDFIKGELDIIKSGEGSNGNSQGLIDKINVFLCQLKQNNGYDNLEESYVQSIQQTNNSIIENKEYEAIIWFEDGCGLENIRAYGVIHSLKDTVNNISYIPADIEENDETIQIIQQQGFRIFFNTHLSYEEIHSLLNKTILIKDLELVETSEKNDVIKQTKLVEYDDININQQQTQAKSEEKQITREHKISSHQSIISVDVAKLDKLMDLVGEMVIAETMVTQNPDLKGLELDNFHKATRQLRKIHSELQDTVMSIRMVPLATTFFKMQRVVRDMNKKLDKDVELEIIGEETEVDKNIIENISDPLMHLIRNAIDHGIETPEERKNKGKSEVGKITLEAKSAGGEVLILVKDDGKGLNKEKILERASKNGLLQKNQDEMTEREIFSLILTPGFSTKDSVTEFSGRGVGLDVVARGIETIGGAVLIESTLNEGTTITLKIPLTLAIINGMNLGVGDLRYTLPISLIRESFKAKEKDLICDPDKNEMIMLRGECHPILRLHQQFKVENAKTSIMDGIIIVAENDEKTICLFADELIGEQQVVVKALPSYIKNTKKVKGLAGCTLLGDGNISLILDIAECMNMNTRSMK